AFRCRHQRPGDHHRTTAATMLRQQGAAAAPNAGQAQQQVPMAIAGAILPLDLLVETLSYLTPLDGWLAAQVCRWWQQLLARDDRLRAQVLKNEECHRGRCFYNEDFPRGCQVCLA